MNDSSFLYARPSFLEGLSRIVDLGSTLNEYNRSRTPDEADYLAIRADWQLVGLDIARALDNGRRELPTSTEVD